MKTDRNNQANVRRLLEKEGIPDEVPAKYDELTADRFISVLEMGR